MTSAQGPPTGQRTVPDLSVSRLARRWRPGNAVSSLTKRWRRWVGPTAPSTWPAKEDSSSRSPPTANQGFWLVGALKEAAPPTLRAKRPVLSPMARASASVAERYVALPLDVDEDFFGVL